MAYRAEPLLNMTVYPDLCAHQCGKIIPLTVNGAYRGEGLTIVEFGREGSTTCGIRVADVLRNDLEGLIRRDDPVELNPRAGSMRLKFKVGNPSTLGSPPD